MGRFLVLLVCASSVLAAPVPKVKAKPTLEGTWEVVERQHDGKPHGHPNIRERWVFSGTDIEVQYLKQDEDVKTYSAKLRLVVPDVTEPTAIEVWQESEKKPRISSGRVEFDGDRVRVAFAVSEKARHPKDAKPGVGVAYIEFKRVDESKLKAK
jgi:uncharacterized protein (TIGR03067 family)